jgi:RNA polymerase sigma factor (sigma-70 family)
MSIAKTETVAIRPASEIELISRNLGLVGLVITRYGGPLDYDECFSAGVVGLWNAAKIYNPQRGRFSTCAIPFIHQAVRNASIDEGYLIRRPRYIFEEVGLLMTTTRKLEATLERKPHVEELAAEIGNKLLFKLIKPELRRKLKREPSREELITRLKKTHEAKSFIDGFAQMNNREPDDNELIFGLTQKQIIFLKSIPSAFTLLDDPTYIVKRIPVNNQYDNFNLRIALKSEMRILTIQERQALKLYYGLDTGDTHNCVEIGKLLGISKETARKLVREAERKLRESPDVKSLLREF